MLKSGVYVCGCVGGFVFVSMYVYVYACVTVSVCMHVCVYVCVNVYVRMSMCVCVRECGYMCLPWITYMIHIYSLPRKVFCFFMRVTILIKGDPITYPCMKSILWIHGLLSCISRVNK